MHVILTTPSRKSVVHSALSGTVELSRIMMAPKLALARLKVGMGGLL